MEKISVVITTYNGEKYLKEQLESLMLQTKLPDEIVIFDDASDDNTPSIIECFKENYCFVNIIFERNSHRVGWKENYRRAINRTTGSIVFLCDQDDIWIPKKIEIMSSVIDQNDSIVLLSSNLIPFYEDKKVIHDSKRGNQFLNDLRVSRVNFRNSFYINRPGCTYCFRRALISYFDTYSFMEYPHDAFLWRTAALMDGLYHINYVSMYYRRHSESATAKMRRSTNAEKIETMVYYLNALDSAKRFILDENVENVYNKMRVIRRYERWAKYRIEYLKNRSIIGLFNLLFYHGCYYSIHAFIGDIVIND